MADQGRKATAIYALLCPTTGEVRYIGKSVNPRARLAHHIHLARKGSNNYSARWVATLLADGRYPVMQILKRVPAGEEWQSHERRCIAEAIASGARLTNVTSGGDGGPEYLTEADRQRRLESIRAALTTPAVNERRAASIKAAWADPVKRARIVERQRQAASDPKRQEELSRAAKARTTQGEERRLEAVRLWWTNDANRTAAADRMRHVGKANKTGCRPGRGRELACSGPSVTREPTA